ASEAMNGQRGDEAEAIIPTMPSSHGRRQQHHKQGGGMKKLQAILGVVIVLGVAAAATSVAVAKPSKAVHVAKALGCSSATIGLTGPFTGPAASAGIDQRNWADLFISYWNSGKAIPGTPKSMHRVKLNAVHADTQLNPQVAATV